MGNELTVQSDIIQDYDDIVRVGQAMAKSGYFDDAKDAAKATVKILAGREMGFGPFASMNGVRIIKGKPTVGANLMASAVRSNPEYDYRIKQLTPKRCVLGFYRNGNELGESTFTVEEAQRAGVGSASPPGKPGTMLQMFPKNMLFARAMSNGVKWYCPDVFRGNTVYTPEELDADVVDADVTEVPEIEEQELEQREEQEQKAHWIDRDKVRRRFWAWTKDAMALSEDDVYEALGVEHIHDYEGTMQEAKERIEAWVSKQTEEDDDRLDIDIRPHREPEPDTDNELVEAAVSEEEGLPF